MAPDQDERIQKVSDQQNDGSVTRRDLARKVAYVAPVVLAVIAAADRPVLAASGGCPPGDPNCIG
jgi:hypothetical protein